VGFFFGSDKMCPTVLETGLTVTVGLIHEGGRWRTTEPELSVPRALARWLDANADKGEGHTLSIELSFDPDAADAPEICPQVDEASARAIAEVWSSWLAGQICDALLA
jgi:hypothetical protein